MPQTQNDPLGKPSKKSAWARIAEGLELTWKTVTGIGLSLLILLALFTVSRELIVSSPDNFVLDGFTVPAALAVKGYTPESIAKQVLMEITRNRNFGKSYFAGLFRTVNVSPEGDREFIIPDEASAKYVSSFLKIADRNTHIKGEIVFDGDYRLSCSIGTSAVIEARSNTIEGLIDSAAVMIFSQIDPINASGSMIARRDRRVMSLATRLIRSTGSDATIRNAIGYHVLGTSQMLSSDPTFAQINLEAALRLLKASSVKSYVAPSYNNLGVLFFTKFEALEDTIQAQVRRGILPIGFINRPKQLLDSARMYFDSALAVDPRYSLTYLNLANVAKAFGGKEGDSLAFRHLLKADSLQPGTPNTLAQLALAYSKANNRRSSMDYLNRALTYEPVEPITCVNQIQIRRLMNLPIVEQMEMLRRIDYTRDQFYYRRVRKFLHYNEPVLNPTSNIANHPGNPMPPV